MEMNEWMSPNLFCSYRYFSELTMTNSALNSSIPGKVISMYPENIGFVSFWNIRHFLSSLPRHNTISSVLAATFIMNGVGSYEHFLASQHVGLLPTFGKSSSVWISIGSGVPPLTSLGYPLSPSPIGIGRDPNSAPQTIILGSQGLEWVWHKGLR